LSIPVFLLKMQVMAMKTGRENDKAALVDR